MSAVIVLRQRNSVHMMTDAASYKYPSGELVNVNLGKAVALPTLNAVISCTGPAELGAWFGYRLPQVAASFDDLIARGEVIISECFDEFADKQRGGDASSSTYLIGWHATAARPAAYAVQLWTDKSTRVAQVLKNSADAGQTIPPRSKILEQSFAGTPLPGADLQAAAGFKLYDDENDHDPELDLLHLIEIMRHEEIEGGHWVGGKALLSSIDSRGITQRVIHHWAEDKVGETIEPLPIAWRAWREARVAAKVAAVVPDGLSRLQRERMVKKARKGTLRVAQ